MRPGGVRVHSGEPAVEMGDPPSRSLAPLPRHPRRRSCWFRGSTEEGLRPPTLNKAKSKAKREKRKSRPKERLLGGGG